MNFLNKKPVALSAIFLGILLIVFRDFAFDPNQLMLNSDQLNGIGSRILRAESAVLTEWDDSRLGGVPTIDALFADAYHPLVWVQFLMDPARAVGFKFILTVWVAFMSAMLLAWNLTGNRWWAGLLGMLYAFSPEFVGGPARHALCVLAGVLHLPIRWPRRQDDGLCDCPACAACYSQDCAFG